MKTKLKPYFFFKKKKEYLITKVRRYRKKVLVFPLLNKRPDPLNLTHPFIHKSSSLSNEVSSKLLVIRDRMLFSPRFGTMHEARFRPKTKLSWHSLLTFFALFRRSGGIDRWPSWYSSVPRPL